MFIWANEKNHQGYHEVLGHLFYSSVTWYMTFVLPSTGMSVTKNYFCSVLLIFSLVFLVLLCFVTNC